jgi:hypothetical protein
VFRPSQKRWGAEVIRLQTGNHGVVTVCKPAGRSAPPSRFVKSFSRRMKFTESRQVTFIPAVQEVTSSRLARSAPRTNTQSIRRRPSNRPCAGAVGMRGEATALPSQPPDQESNGWHLNYAARETTSRLTRSSNIVPSAPGPLELR